MATYPRPANGWGQAAADATNGFGGAAGNATNGFGTIHPISPPHPATDLVGIAPIYGLSFDGVNDYLRYDALNTLSGNFTVKWKGDFTREQDGIIYAGSTTFHNGCVMRTTVAQSRHAINSVQYDSATSFLATTTASTEFEIDRLGTSLTLTRGGVLFDTLVVATANHEIEYIGTRSDFLNFLQFTVLEYFEIDGVRADDSNNWVGITQFGTTRVVSMDNGATWNPA